MVVDRNADDLCARRHELGDGALIAGSFHDRGLAGRQKQPTRDGDALLDAAHDDDTACFGDDPARHREVAGDGTSQRDQTRRVAVLRQPHRAAVGQAVLHQPSPRFDGKQSGIGTAGKKIERQSAAITIEEVRAARLRRRQRHLHDVIAGVVMEPRCCVERQHHAVRQRRRNRDA